MLPVRNAILTLAAVASVDKELILLEDSYHVAPMDYDKDRIAAICLAFIQRLNPVG